jgi:HEPN domain-containing protein
MKLKEITREWIAKAESDFLTAERLAGFDEPTTDTICFHCQQCAEKYLKAYMSQHDIEFEKTHNLLYLLELAKKKEKEFEAIRDQLIIVNDYSDELRYPGDWVRPSLEDTQ